MVRLSDVDDVAPRLAFERMRRGNGPVQTEELTTITCWFQQKN